MSNPSVGVTAISRQRTASKQQAQSRVAGSGMSDLQEWPTDLVECIREHLSMGICDGILNRCTEDGVFVPKDWTISSRRMALIDYVCKRAAYFIDDEQLSRLREAMELTAYHSWRRRDSSQLPIRRTPKTAPGIMQISKLADEPLEPEREMVMDVLCEADVLSARTKALNLAKCAGASLFVRTRIATVVTELARRLQRHAKDGQLELRLNDSDIELVSRDSGPIIENLAQVLADPESHRSGPCAAIVACQSLATSFSAISRPRIGTTLTVRLSLE